MQRRLFLTTVAAALLALSVGCAGAAKTGNAAPDAKEPKRVLVISIDGLRPDVLLRADAPNIRALMKNGSFTMWAQTTDVAITLPSHTSMLTGVPPEIHGVKWNDILPAADVIYPKVPTLFQLAKAAGYTTGMAAGKRKFREFQAPGALDWSFVSTDKGIDADVATEAVKIIHDHQPQVMFVHFPSVDSTGHAVGWGSPQQVEAAGRADEAVGRVLDALKAAGLKDKTLIILSADHGGAGRTHGGLDARSRHIPWIAVGPGVTKNFDLTRIQSLAVHTEDTCATALAYLGIALPTNLTGKPVAAIFQPAPTFPPAPAAMPSPKTP